MPLIATRVDHDARAQSRSPMDKMRQGCPLIETLLGAA